MCFQSIPFEFEFYMVYWEDIQSDSGWRTLKEIQKSKACHMCINWLVGERKQRCTYFNE